jgi:hypothetical protein
MLRDGLTAREAAQRLGVSPRRIRALASRRQLPAETSTSAWLIDPAAVAYRTQQQPVAHRVLEPANAWALLALASGEPSLAPSLAAVSASMRSRLRGRLRHASLIELAPLLRKRANLRLLRADEGDLPSILAERGVVATGVSVADDYRFDITAPGTIELYTAPDTAAALQRKYVLQPSARANVLLHVIDALWPFAEGVTRAPPQVAALDLIESSDRRTARAGRAYFD